MGENKESLTELFNFYIQFRYASLKVSSDKSDEKNFIELLNEEPVLDNECAKALVNNKEKNDQKDH